MRRGYLAVHVALFLYVFAFVALHMTARRIIPSLPASLELRRPALGLEPLAITTSDAAKDAYPNLGSRSIFATLIPRPPSPPPSPPSPPPRPAIEKLTASWRLVAILPGGIARFEDGKTREEWEMKQLDTRAVVFKGSTTNIHLTKVDEVRFEVELTTEFPGADQRRALSLF